MRVAAAFVRLTRKRQRSADELVRAFRGRATPRAAPIPKRLRTLATVSETRPLDHLVYTLTPPASSLHLVYLHGGCFVNDLIGPHWDMVEQLIRATSATVHVPQYPLAPAHRHGETFALLEHLHRELGGQRVVVAGDSAGGNLALVYALRCKELGLPMPERLILFAPWVELTMTNPAISAVQPRDPMLWAPELAEYGRWWAGDADPAGPLLSPVNADLRGLPPVHIFQGADDILAPDAKVLHERLVAAGNRVDYHETPRAFHVFMGATFTPEAKRVFREISSVVGSGT